MGTWDAWIGREEVRTDRVDAGLVSRWLATFDRDALSDGNVPQGLHWCLCVPDAATAQLGPDGHPARDDSQGSFLPPIALPRRMWASSKVDFFAPLRVGEAVTRNSRVQTITEKSGGSGQLVFVDVAHETFGEFGLSVREVQSIVYREAAGPDAALSPPKAEQGFVDVDGLSSYRMLTPSEPLLFRFSALLATSRFIFSQSPSCIISANARIPGRRALFCANNLVFHSSAAFAP